MANATWLPGDVKTRPGVYSRVVNAAPPAIGVNGIVAALFRASWGPFNTAVTLTGIDAVANTYGTAGNIIVAQEAFKGGAKSVLAYRIGTGGSAATATLQDTTGTPVNILTVNAKYPGVRGNSLSVTTRVNLTDATLRDLIVYEGTTIRQQWTYAPGSDEAAAVVAAVTATGSDWITVTKLVAGDGILAAVTQKPLSTGTDPTVSGTEYSAALTALETLDWNVLAADTEDTTIQATIAAYIDRVRSQDGKLVTAVIGEPTAVTLSTRLSDAAGHNDFAIVYVGNGFTRYDDDRVTVLTIEGYKAAARVAGYVAGSAITDSLTHFVVPDATGLVGALVNSDIEQAILNGMLVFSTNSQRQVQIEYGITTLITPDANHDNGWKKIRRVKTRDYLMDQIGGQWDLLIGKVNNDADGRATLIASGQGVINSMIRQGALTAGTIVEDSANPPSGDAAWFTITVDDVDAAEHIYETFAYSFSGTLSTTS